jgi:hypothetical protein
MPPSATRGDEQRHPNGADQRLRQTRDQARFSVKKDGSVARRSRYDTAIPMQDRWLFPGNKRGRPMTTRQFSRLFHDARPIIFYNRASLERTRLSEPKFPASWENTGNFIHSRLRDASTVAKNIIQSVPYGPIPCAS